MATLLCCAACQTASCACQITRCFLTDGKMSVVTANVVYLLLFAMWTFLAFALQEWGAPQFNFYSFNVGCTDIPNIDISACKGENAVFRVSLGMMLWFVFIMIGNLFSKRVHTGLWGPKILSLIVLTIGLFFTPIVGQDGYVQFARIISSVFLVSQLVYFIDAAYSWNSYFAFHAYGDDFGENRNWVAFALMLCFLMMLVVAISNILLYIFYNYCTRQTVFITVTLVLIIVATVSQLNIQDTDSSLVTSCIVSAYATYLCWSAVSADECNPDQQRTQGQTIFAFCVTATSLIWSSYSAGTRKYTTNLIPLTDDEEEEEEEEEEVDNSSMFMFHVSMATGSVYMSMLLTNWGTVAGKQSDAQMWVSIVSQWISMMLYGWTLLAPKCLPDRDFN